MENLWTAMAREVENFNCPTVEILQNKIAEVWENLSKEYMNNLATSMPNRIEAVIAAQGACIDY